MGRKLYRHNGQLVDSRRKNRAAVKIVKHRSDYGGSKYMYDRAKQRLDAGVWGKHTTMYRDDVRDTMLAADNMKKHQSKINAAVLDMLGVSTY